MGVLGDQHRLRAANNQFGTYGGITNAASSYTPGINWGWTGSFKPNTQQPVGTAFGGSGSAGGQRPQHAAPEMDSLFRDKLMEQMRNPGISDAVVEGMINKGSDEIAQSAGASKLALQERANAAGGSLGGGMQVANREMDANTAGQRANLGRDARVAQGQSQLADRQQSLSLADRYMGRLVDQNESNYRYDQSQAQQGGGGYFGAASNYKPTQAAASGNPFGSWGAGGKGGGANSGPGPSTSFQQYAPVYSGNNSLGGRDERLSQYDAGQEERTGPDGYKYPSFGYGDKQYDARQGQGSQYFGMAGAAQNIAARNRQAGKDAYIKSY